MAQKTAQQVAAKWRAGMSNSTQAITDGVNRMTVNPAQQAVQKQAVMRARVLAAIDSGKWAAGLNRVTLNGYKQAMLTKGIQNIQNGLAAGEAKQTTFMQDFLPFVYNVQAQVKAMPNGTDAEREQRMLANARLIKQYKRPQTVGAGS